MVTAFLVIAGLIIFGLMILVAGGGGITFPWVEFYLRGKESGFKIREINLLRKVAVEHRLQDPAALYWSERQLDRCIRGTISRLRSRGIMDDPKSISFLKKLFDFRKQVEFNLPKNRAGLRSSRNMPTGQRIRIPLPGVGAYESQVVENMRKYIAITYPKGKPLPAGQSWRGQIISIYFWRSEDAGYYFETQVIGDYFDKKNPILHVAHSDNLIRAQKRGSVRLTLTQIVNLYPLQGIEAANEIVEPQPGYRGKMIDLSEDGFAVLVGGKARAGLPIKMQLFMGDTPIVMCGAVKNVTYNQNKNQSVLHVQATKPSDKMRISILTHVYGIFNDRPQGAPQVSLEDAGFPETASPSGEEGPSEDAAPSGNEDLSS
jgi:c-di-GMP-binding flagellar brake protein YcgR